MLVWLYGYGLIYLISGFMAYELNWYQTLILAGFSYVVLKLCLKTWTSFLISLVSGLVFAGVYGYWHYRKETLADLIAGLQDFFSVYGTSLSVSTVTITNRHQILVIMLLGLGLMKLLDWLDQGFEKSFIYLNAVTGLSVVLGYLAGLMKSFKDYEALLILAAAVIINYFYHYYKNEFRSEKAFGPFVPVALVFVAVILFGSCLLYNFDDNPFEREKPRVVRTAVEREEAELPAGAMYGLVSGAPMPVASSFEYEGILVLTLDGEEVAHLKTGSFESYNQGVWEMDEDLYLSKDELDGIQKSTVFEAHNYHKYYQLETIKVTVEDMVTNALPTAAYQAENAEFIPYTHVYEDTFRGTYYTDQMVGEGYNYLIEAVIPAYGLNPFERLIWENSQRAVPRDLYPLTSDAYPVADEIHALALEVTEGIDNPYDQAKAIESYLRNNYAYNEKPPVPPSEADPVDTFLFGSREGFCQHFASAQVLMMRSLDIPARYVTGFYVSERDLDEEDYSGYSEDLYDGVYSVYDSDAHAWAEAYFPEVGWIMFEATPGRYYKSSAYEPLEDLVPEDELSPEEASIRISHSVIYGIISAALVLLLMILFVLFIRRRNFLKKRSNKEKLKSLMTMIIRFLKYIDLTRQPGETVREFSLRTDDTFHKADKLQLNPIVSIYEQAAYSTHPIDESNLAPFTAYYTQLRKVMRKRLALSTRIYLHVIGLFNL